MSQPHRILSIIGSRVLYGQERANLLVMETLKLGGSEVIAIVEDDKRFRVMPQELTRLDIPYIEVPFLNRRAKGELFRFLIGNSLNYFRLRKRLTGVVKALRPTHIHVPQPFAFLMADAFAPSDIPIIYRIGDQPSTHNAMWRWIWRRIVHRVTHFVANSRFIVDELLLLGVSPNQITLIYNKPPERLNPPQPNADPETGHILFIGQLSEQKGVDRLIKAFHQIATEFPDARLTIVGRISDWSGDDWQRALRDRTLSDPLIGERVFFPGEQEDIYSFLARAAFLVVPSVFQEPLANVVGEAKAAARPSVVFPSGGLPELVRHGEDGFICRDTSTEALAEGLRYYLTDPSRTKKQGKKACLSLTELGVNEFEQRWQDVYDFTAKSDDSSSAQVRDS